MLRLRTRACTQSYLLATMECFDGTETTAQLYLKKYYPHNDTRMPVNGSWCFVEEVERGGQPEPPALPPQQQPDELPAPPQQQQRQQPQEVGLGQCNYCTLPVDGTITICDVDHTICELCLLDLVLHGGSTCEHCNDMARIPQQQPAPIAGALAAAWAAAAPAAAAAVAPPAVAAVAPPAAHARLPVIEPLFVGDHCCSYCNLDLDGELHVTCVEGHRICDLHCVRRILGVQFRCQACTQVIYQAQGVNGGPPVHDYADSSDEEAPAAACKLCMVDFEDDGHVVCSSGQHRVCNDCLPGMVNNFIKYFDTAPLLVVTHNQLMAWCERLPCQFCSDSYTGQGSFSMDVVRQLCSGAQMTAFVRKIGMRMRDLGVEEVRREMAAAAPQTVDTRANHIRDHLMTDRCPNCNTAWLDFGIRDCLELQCKMCQRYFCGMCIKLFDENEGSDERHHHLTVCPRHPLHGTRSAWYYINRDWFEWVRRQRQSEAINLFLDSLTTDERAEVVGAVERDLLDSGFRIVLYGGHKQVQEGAEPDGPVWDNHKRQRFNAPVPQPAGQPAAPQPAG